MIEVDEEYLAALEYIVDSAFGVLNAIPRIDEEDADAQGVIIALLIPKMYVMDTYKSQRTVKKLRLEVGEKIDEWVYSNVPDFDDQSNTQILHSIWTVLTTVKDLARRKN